MKLTRKWLMAIALVLSLSMAISGTLAYLTDRDTVTNTFTLGNVDIKVEEEYDQDEQLNPGVAVDKEAGIKNVHTEPAYVWMVVSVPTTLKDHITLGWADGYTPITDGVTSPHTGYTGYLVKYTSVLKAGESTGNILKSVMLDADVDYQGNSYVTVVGGVQTPITVPDEKSIIVDAFAIQTEGIPDMDNNGVDVNDAYAAYTAQWKGLNGGESNLPTGTGVDTAAEVIAALKAGNDVYLTADVALDTNTSIVIPAGIEATLDLNGYTLSAENTRTETHNFMIDVKGGTLNISNGTVSMKHTGTNMGWNGATTVIDVTAGGVLNLDGVNVENQGGTDMNFGVHLNNWGEVTLNANNCVFDAPYCGVRVFNSGYDDNNVKITNSTLKGATRAFWVHNYASEDFGGKLYSGSSEAYDETKVAARLNLDIYNNGNTFKITGTAKSPIRYGFGTTVYFDASGNEVP